MLSVLSPGTNYLDKIFDPIFFNEYRLLILDLNLLPSGLTGLERVCLFNRRTGDAINVSLINEVIIPLRSMASSADFYCRFFDHWMSGRICIMRYARSMTQFATHRIQFRGEGEDIVEFDTFIAGIICDVAWKAIQIEILLFVHQGFIRMKMSRAFPETGLPGVALGTG